MFVRLVGLLLCACVLCRSGVGARTRESRPSIGTLKKLSVEQLIDVEVTSVSKGSERLGGAAAAVTVVTNEDIRRSGATTVRQALRFVPGIHVARQTSNTWAIGSRGFSSIVSENLLVLSDTRSVYTPLVSGVFWDVQNYLLQDVDRIEVIRGPSATRWGSNAVNGVIHITTKSARDTQGLYVESSAGSEERGAAAVRYGGRLGERTYYRLRRSDSSDSQLRVDYDRTHRNDPSFDDDLHTVDGEFQQRLGFGRHEMTWGVNEHFTVNHNCGKVIWNLEPDTSRDNLIGGFVQDQIAIRDSLRLTAGTKLERNDFERIRSAAKADASHGICRHSAWCGARSRAPCECRPASTVTWPSTSPIRRSTRVARRGEIQRGIIGKVAWGF